MPNKLNNDKILLPNHNNIKSREITKRTILISWGSIIGILLVFWGISGLLESIDENFNNDLVYDPNAQTIIFHDIDYNEDIFKDPIYMGMDRNIYISNLNTGITESLEPEDYLNYGKDVEFMANLVEYIIRGYSDKYNECFADSYIDNEPKESFTMQKLYNIKITKISEDKSDNGEYTEYIFFLEYMIYQNNGSFRTDVGSDASVAQYVTLTDEQGELKISKLVRTYYQ